VTRRAAKREKIRRGFMANTYVSFFMERYEEISYVCDMSDSTSRSA
jgi:hypothetical protein